MDAVKQLLCERFLNLPMRHAHGLVGCSSLALKFGYWLLFDRTLGRFFPELLKLFELAKQGVVDAGRARFKDLLAARRDFEMSAAVRLRSGRPCQDRSLPSGPCC